MNSKEQAKKGFKTFILTLVISLVIFSGIYYVINSEQDDDYYGDYNKVEEKVDVLGSEAGAGGTNEVDKVSERDTTEDESVFADLAEQKMDEEQGRQVLAGSDSVDTTSTIDTTTIIDTTVVADTTIDTTAEVAQTTVPDTGVSGPTVGVVLTLIILGFAAYIMFLGPRNVALHNFEKDFLDDLE